MAKFLIIDDDAACRRLVQHFLSPYGRCDVAHDGSEAIGAFRISLDAGEPYDLVCLDIMMPGTDGHQVLDAIRHIESQRGIRGSDGVKVIMTTALTDSKHCIRAFREGCESYVTKPIHEQELLAQVRELLGDLRRRPQSSPASSPQVLPTGKTPLREPARLPRYLIVDDDGVCRELLKDILSPYGMCDFAYDGDEAVDAVRLAIEDGEPYNLICLDIMMPGSSGHAALEGIRRVEAQNGLLGRDGVPVIMTTALRDSKHCVQAFREGCECYVTKPVDEGELLEKIQELGALTEAACGKKGRDEFYRTGSHATQP